MSKGNYLGEFEMLVLAALLRLGDDAYGVPVRQEIEDRTTRAVSIGAVYTTLSRLADKGYVESQVGIPTATRGGRAKRYFQVTTSGKRALEASVSAITTMTFGYLQQGTS